jgi:hypothetical protein
MSTHQPNSSVVQPERADRGIALIVVLGILALLLIIGVGFSITMRIERMAAKSYSESVRGRQLLQAATSRLMSDLNAYLATPPLLVYPDFDPGPNQNPIWTSLNAPPTGQLASDMLSPEALSFIPRTLRPDALIFSNQIEWLELRDADDVLRGKYAYIVADCSGFLDASVVGGTTRGEGISGSEIRVSDITPEFNGNSEPFRLIRTNEWRQFDSLPEIWVIGDDAGVIGDEPVNLFPFSRFVPDVHWDTVNSIATPRINIAGNENDLNANKAAIVDALNKAGVTDPDLVFNGLLDYVDSDSIPQDLLSASTEAVPMFNEIVISNNISIVTLGPGVVESTYDLYVVVETWNPFPVDITMSLSPPVFTFLTQPNTLNPAMTDLVSGPPGSVNHPANSFRVSRYHFRKVAQNVTFPGNDSVESRLQTFSGNYDIIVDGASVDRIPSGMAIQSGACRTRLSGISSGSLTYQPGAISVADPRLNYAYSAADGRGWGTDTPPTLGTTNARVNAFSGEGVSPMYVRNLPLASVAELGYLSVGNPWQTVALYETPVSAVNSVLDYFTVRPPASRAGLVNVNTTNEQVLGSVFNGMTVQSIPGGPSTLTMNWASSVQFARDIIARTQTQPFMNISEFGNFNKNYFGQLTGKGLAVTDAEIETIIRKSYELLGIRQNLFTAIVAAQLLSPTGVPIIEQRAVAVIWRDPIPNANNHHASFVRFYKPLVE